MSGKSPKHFNLPWHQHDSYRIGVYGASGTLPSRLLPALQPLGFTTAGGGLVCQAPRPWRPLWDKLYHALQEADALAEVEIAITPDAEQAESSSGRKSPGLIAALADSLWMGEALLEDRLMCYLQPVLSARDQIFGYESFARVRTADGSIIGGDRIIAASRTLGIEYAVDRHLHIEAIKTYASSGFNGFLFVNLCPGFIQRPAVYLEGLSETARQFGILAKHIVLDFTQAEAARDVAHLAGICQFARSRGYSIALDDIGSRAGATKLLDIRPDFVKLDMHLVHRAETDEGRDIIHQIIELVHATGGTVIGEGVETESMHQALKSLGTDLFQGYLFSPPMPVEAALKLSTGTA